MSEIIINRPPPNLDKPIAQDATLGVKFNQKNIILDDWWIIGGTRWNRTIYRLKHPIVYSKRGLRNLYRRIKSIFIEEKSIQCRKELLHLYPDKHDEK